MTEKTTKATGPITFELVPEAELPATKEVSQIESMRSEIAAFMAPELEAEIDKTIEDAKTIVAVTDAAGVAVAKASATALQKARTQKVEAPHKKFKAPITAIGSTLDARKRDLSKKLEAEEARVRGLISKFEQAEEEKRQEALRLHREKVTGRINDAIKAGVQVDADFADLASDEEWASALSKAVEEKAKADEVASMIARAAAQGFVLPAEDIEHMDLLIAAGELADREAGLMLWLGAATENRRKQDAALRTERRMAQCEELGIEVAVSIIRKASDDEWDAVVAPAVAATEALELVVPASAILAPASLPVAVPAPVVARVVTSEPPAPADTDERLANAPAMEVLRKLSEFGKKHCAQKGELRTDFVEIFQAMRSYVEAL